MTSSLCGAEGKVTFFSLGNIFDSTGVREIEPLRKIVGAAKQSKQPVRVAWVNGFAGSIYSSDLLYNPRTRVLKWAQKSSRGERTFLVKHSFRRVSVKQMQDAIRNLSRDADGFEKFIETLQNNGQQIDK